MLETVCKEILDKNTFLIHFIDKNIDSISTDKSNELNLYDTGDDSEVRMALRVTAIPRSVLIDIKIKYPPNFYNPNYYELLDFNEKSFQDYYNEIMDYNPVDYNEIMSKEESPSKEIIGK
ncbi:MAG: hypothetical protein WAK14_10465 [Methanobacterium sp.]